MGTQLLASGFDVKRDLAGDEFGLAALNKTRPDQVRAVHESYLEQGSKALRTHTFAMHREQLARLNLEPAGEQLHASALDSAEQAAEFWAEDRTPPALILGTLGPAAQPDADSERLAKIADGIRTQVSWLAARSDALLLETFSDLPTLESALGAAAQAASDLPIAVSIATAADGTLLGRGDLRQVAELSRQHDVCLLAVNCVNGAMGLHLPLEALREHWAGPLGAWPNAGEADSHESPEEFAERMAGMTVRYELQAVGACCGALPSHLAALSRALGLPTPHNPFES